MEPCDDVRDDSTKSESSVEDEEEEEEEEEMPTPSVETGGRQARFVTKGAVSENLRERIDSDETESPQNAIKSNDKQQ